MTPILTLSAATAAAGSDAASTASTRRNQILTGPSRSLVRRLCRPAVMASSSVRGSPDATGPLLEHDLFRKPVPTFRDHALDQSALRPRRNAVRRVAAASMNDRSAPASTKRTPLSI